MILSLLRHLSHSHACEVQWNEKVTASALSSFCYCFTLLQIWVTSQPRPMLLLELSDQWVLETEQPVEVLQLHQQLCHRPTDCQATAVSSAVQHVTHRWTSYQLPCLVLQNLLWHRPVWMLASDLLEQPWLLVCLYKCCIPCEHDKIMPGFQAMFFSSVWHF